MDRAPAAARHQHTVRGVRDAAEIAGRLHGVIRQTAALRRIRALRRDGHPLSRRLFTGLRPVPRTPRSVSGRIRGLSAGLRPHDRSRAVQPIARSPGAGAAHPEGQVLTSRIISRAAWIVVWICAIDLALREIARRSLFRLVIGQTPPIAAMVVAATAAAAIGIASASAASRLRRDKTRPGTAPLMLTALFAVGLALQLQLGARLQSDGFYYFAYLRSLAFDRDVDFTNDYKLLGLGDKTHLFQPTPTGHAQSAWTIGPAIVWSPFFAVGHIVATRLHASGRDVSTDGTSFPYRQAVC